jgi:putative phosphoesterase
MVKVGLIADNHDYLDPQVFEYFKDVDEIWHAGDFGTLKVAKDLENIAPVKGVHGNIDDQVIRDSYPYSNRFTVEGVDVWIVHIGGNPGRYSLPIRREMKKNPPNLFICGHSHILKIARDPDNKEMLFINPGAAGRQGFHTERTIIRFQVDNGSIDEVEVINLGPRSDRE